MTRPVLATTDAGAKLVGLRFRPEVASRVLGVPAHELTDRDVPLDDLWNPGAIDPSLRSDSRRAHCCGPRCDRAVADRVTMLHWDRQTQSSMSSVSLLTAAHRERIDELAGHLGISERQLHRRFVASVGYSPKTFQRIVRFRSSRPGGGRHSGAAR